MSLDGFPAPSFDELLGRVFTQRPSQGLHGFGLGFDPDRDEGMTQPERFAFAYDPRGGWRLDRPPGRLRAVGDHRREVMIGRDDSTRRCRVGAGWAGEPAVYLLRPPLTGVSRAQWLALSIIEPPSADQIANRACWRVTIRDDDAETRLWFDAEIPLVLRIATRAIATDNAGISAEIVELHLSAPEPHLWNHPLLGEPSQVALDPVPPAAEDLLDSIKTVMADAHTVQLFAWEPAGSFVARIVMPTTHGPAELLIDRRSITAPPYEGTHAAMIRGGDARWTYSFDHDPEIGHALVRELAKTLPRLIS